MTLSRSTEFGGIGIRWLGPWPVPANGRLRVVRGDRRGETRRLVDRELAAAAAQALAPTDRADGHDASSPEGRLERFRAIFVMLCESIGEWGPRAL